jgi:AcrR family transcriptional regulator
MTDVAPPNTLTRQALYEAIWTRPMSAVARELGLSSNGLAKICDRLLIPYPGRGHWAKAAAGRPAPQPLPPPPVEAEDPIVIGAARAGSRRRHTRATGAERNEQLMDAAAALIVESGLPALTMKSVARRVGISEAQAHNYFRQRKDLLIALARRELTAMETRRRAELERGHDRQTRIALSTITYLREAAERGALIQVLTQSSEVQDALRAERAATRRADRDQILGRLAETYGVPQDVGRALTSVLTAICLRAGRLVGGGRIDLETAERLTLAITMSGNRDIVRRYRGAAASPRSR